MVIVNASAVADALLAVRSPIAERVEIHVSRMEQDVMTMRQLSRVELPVGATVRFEPGGMHLMLLGLKQPLVAGETVPLVLSFAEAGERRIELQVQSIGAPAP